MLHLSSARGRLLVALLAVAVLGLAPASLSAGGDITKFPLAFEANGGRADPQVKFLAYGSGYALFFTPQEVILTIGSTTLRMQLVGSAPTEIGGVDRQGVLGTAMYGGVRYAGAYPGVDFLFSGYQRQLAYELRLAPGANLRSVALQFQGGDLQVDGEGGLLLVTPAGRLILHKPYGTQESSRGNQRVSCSYVLRDGNRVGVEAGGYDAGSPLVIHGFISFSDLLERVLAASASANAASLSTETSASRDVDAPANVAAVVRTLTGFTRNVLPRNDDGSTGRVPIGFTLNYFGQNYTHLYVNNNGNVTFDRSLGTYTPFPITTAQAVIIAPFFADVDTRGAGSAEVTYGNDTVNGRPTFGVNWVNVGYFGSHTDKLNSFQLLLMDRSDIGLGDFDMEFNYNTIKWETGDASGGTNGFGGSSARAGYSNGTGNAGTFFELSGSAVPGGLLDSNPTTGLINRAIGNPVNGRYIFQVRNGAVGSSTCSTLSGTTGTICNTGTEGTIFQPSGTGLTFRFNLRGGSFSMSTTTPGLLVLQICGRFRPVVIVRTGGSTSSGRANCP